MHNFSRCTTPRPAPALQPRRSPLSTAAKSPARPAPARQQPPSPAHHLPLEKDREAAPARRARCSPATGAAKGKNGRDAHEGRRMERGKEDEGTSPDHPPPLAERIKPKTGGVTPQGAQIPTHRASLRSSACHLLLPGPFLCPSLPLGFPPWPRSPSLTPSRTPPAPLPGRARIPGGRPSARRPGPR